MWRCIGAVLVLGIGCNASETTSTIDGDSGEVSGGVVFGAPAVVFGASGTRIYRLHDANQDGDYNEADEASLFHDGVDGPIVALDAFTVVAIDTASSPSTLWLLHDEDGDGSTSTTGEARVWFDGQLPDGATVGTLDAIARAPQGGVFVANHGGVNDELLRLVDTNDDGVVAGADEILSIAQWRALAGADFDSLVVDRAGTPYIVHSDAIDRIDAGQVRPFLPSAVTMALGLSVIDSPPAVVPRADGALSVSAIRVFDGGSEVGIYVLHDVDQDGSISENEVITRWSSATPGGGGWPDSLAAVDDGSLIGARGTSLSNGLPLFRFTDSDGDGASLLAGESQTVRSEALARRHGQLEVPMDLASLSAVAVSGPTPSAPTGCLWIEGSWKMANSCLPNPVTCVVAQDGCELFLQCDGQPSFGSLAGSSLTMNDVCTATVSGNAINGTCQGAQTPSCSFTMSRE